MGKVLIVEGPRCSGKTTMATTLVKKFGWEYLKVERGTDPFEDQNQMLTTSLAKEENVVIDRFHLTEYIGSLYWERDNYELATIKTQRMNRLLHQHEATGYLNLIILNPPNHVIYERLKDRTIGRKQDMSPPIAEIVWTYLANLTKWPMTWFYDMKRLETSIERFVEYGHFI